MKRGQIYQEYCIGCGLCSAKGEGEMSGNRRGYVSFKQEPDRRVVAFCEKVCPASGHSLRKLNEGKLWGEAETVFLGHADDQEIRKRASSGGILTAVSIFLLESGKVDGIVHVCQDEWNPMGTVTCVSTKAEEVLARSGSRYAVSHPLLDMWELIEPGKKYCFIGKPCDVTALRNYLEREEGGRGQFPYLLTFFCAGLPSKQANEQLLAGMGCPQNQCRSLQYRGDGWPGFATAIDKTGSKYSLDYDTAWGKILGRDIHSFCRFCMDGIGERADISCGDAWYLNEMGKPDFLEKEGRNIIFSRNEAGQKLLQEARDAGYIRLETMDDEGYLKKIQNYQYIRKATMLSKITACRLLGHSVPYTDLGKIRKFCKYAGYKEHFKIFKGTIKRVMTKKM